MAKSRHHWASLNDRDLLAECEVDTYRASGPGGQKRNKTSSAVRIRHPASGLIVIAEESRSQHENREKGLKRLRQAFYLKLREPISAESLIPNGLAETPEWLALRTAGGRFEVGRRDARFWPMAGFLLDVLDLQQARLSDAAACLGCSTGNLVNLLEQDPKLWEAANHLRQKHGQKPLVSS